MPIPCFAYRSLWLCDYVCVYVFGLVHFCYVCITGLSLSALPESIFRSSYTRIDGYTERTLFASLLFLSAIQFNANPNKVSWDCESILFQLTDSSLAQSFFLSHPRLKSPLLLQCCSFLSFVLVSFSILLFPWSKNSILFDLLLSSFENKVKWN